MTRWQWRLKQAAQIPVRYGSHFVQFIFSSFWGWTWSRQLVCPHCGNPRKKTETFNMNRLNHQLTSKDQIQAALNRLSNIAIALIEKAGGKVELSEVDIQRLSLNRNITVRTTINPEQKTLTLEIVNLEPPVGGG